ncbi:hypothetical protein IRJ41_024062 [Triplophysa rosa]|uniref:Uncharacterized protein n=1 Tax=Triplophysa rosa TaxID=992332 RepID=A0A9W7X710_TRIRA|nr:hypothetical protein IRJ41_024062 [Triplophysa rosa]
MAFSSAAVLRSISPKTGSFTRQDKFEDLGIQLIKGTIPDESFMGYCTWMGETEKEREKSLENDPCPEFVLSSHSSEEVTFLNCCNSEELIRLLKEQSAEVHR